MHTFVGVCGVGCLVTAELFGVDGTLIRGILIGGAMLMFGYAISGLVEHNHK